MSPEQAALVQSTFAKVAPIANQAAIIFYDDLFSRDPSLRPMFPEDMTEQRQKLMATLGTAVAGLQQWETIVPVVQALGARHVGYGVKPEHYDLVGAALIATLEKGLGPDFTPDAREAWIACYGAITKEMLAAA